MNEYIAASVGAAWLGILTSISPCPLASNIAAISFISRRVNRPWYVVATGILYTIGRSLTYIVLAFLIINSLLSMPALSNWLQKYMHKILGPILIITGMVLLNLLSLPGFNGGSIGQWCQKRAQQFGLAGSFLIGILFALTFCPVSAALFFTGLIPLSVKHSSPVFMPLLYGIGTALPVFAAAFVIAAGANSLGKFFHKITQIELWARRLTGILFIAVGFYFTLTYSFGLKLIP